MATCFIAEISGSIGKLYLAGSSKAVWKDSEPGKVALHVAMGSEVETSQELKEIEDEVQAIVPNPKAFLNARFQYVQRWNYYFSNGALERISDGYITTGTAGMSQQQVGVSTWFSYDLNTNILAYYNGFKFNLGSIPNLPSGIKITGGLAIADVAEWNLGPHAIVSKVWMEHNIQQANQRGMLIHIKFDINNMLSEPGKLNVYFEHADGRALRDLNNNYGSADGAVALNDSFTPPYTRTTFNDYQVFMPYQEFHLDRGEHALRFIISIYDVKRQKFVGSSDYQYITYTTA